LDILKAVFTAVVADVITYYVCKWLSSRK